MNLKGYIFSREFFGERVPQHIQNIILKDYCRNKNINFLLSATEYNSKDSTFILYELLKDINKYDGYLFYSLFQLPKDKKKRHNFFKKIRDNGKELHFAVENLIVKNQFDYDKVEKIFLLKGSLYPEQKINRGKLRNFVTKNHEKTKRDYLERMMNQKIECMKVSKKYGYEYWDGGRKYGYGGYKYIPGHLTLLAKKIIKSYSLHNDSKILDLGCGKGFLLYEIKKILKNINITGIDYSKYAIKNSKKEIKKNLVYGNLNNKLNFKNKSFDLVLCINTLHNLELPEIIKSLKEIERIGVSKYICVESFRNEKEQFNLQCWALTAETILNVKSWKWLMEKANYRGDFEFIFFK